MSHTQQQILSNELLTPVVEWLLDTAFREAINIELDSDFSMRRDPHYSYRKTAFALASISHQFRRDVHYALSKQKQLIFDQLEWVHSLRKHHAEEGGSDNPTLDFLYAQCARNCDNEFGWRVKYIEKISESLKQFKNHSEAALIETQHPTEG